MSQVSVEGFITASFPVSWGLQNDLFQDGLPEAINLNSNELYLAGVTMTG